jgi:hypothetical protein
MPAMKMAGDDPNRMGPVGSEPGKRPARISNIEQGTRNDEGEISFEIRHPLFDIDIRSILGRSFLSP